LKQKETEETKKSHVVKFHGPLSPHRAPKTDDPKGPITNNRYSFVSSFPSFPSVVQSLENVRPMSATSVPGLASIIVPCWNQLEFTRQCVIALKNHTRPPWELIVIDNGSTDGTGAYLSGVQDSAAVPALDLDPAPDLNINSIRKLKKQHILSCKFYRQHQIPQ
jgi:cellulose synthase/poly-beta-1,6-N-acetylglucosamine synthase-like glycosyltransferase